MKVSFTHSQSKVKSLADGISNAILQGRLREGDNLRSINEASQHYGVSRDTVFKAYNELKKRGLIDSTAAKGYFVTGEVNHVLLLLDTYSPFKQKLYNRFVAKLPEGYKVDLLFHQYNPRLFETIVRESIGKYSSYVIMNISNDELAESLKLIPTSKLLLLDFGAFDKAGYSYICQDFDQAIYDCLCECEPLLQKYRKLTLIFPEENSHPVSTIEFFKRFSIDKHFEFTVLRNDKEWSGAEKDTVYICITADDMVKVIKDADEKSLKVGSDVGMIVYNDNPVLEVIKDGITAFSIDFGWMGEKAAEFVVEKKEVHEYLTTKVVTRSSL